MQKRQRVVIHLAVSSKCCVQVYYAYHEDRPAPSLRRMRMAARQAAKLCDSKAAQGAIDVLAIIIPRDVAMEICMQI